jgi:rubrerythrin
MGINRGHKLYFERRSRGDDQPGGSSTVMGLPFETYVVAALAPTAAGEARHEMALEARARHHHLGQGRRERLICRQCGYQHSTEVAYFEGLPRCVKASACARRRKHWKY